MSLCFCWPTVIFYIMFGLLILYICILTHLFFFYFCFFLYIYFSLFSFIFIFHFHLFIYFIYLFLAIISNLCLSQNFYCHGISLFYFLLSTWICLRSNCLLYNIYVYNGNNRLRISAAAIGTKQSFFIRLRHKVGWISVF